MLLYMNFSEFHFQFDFSVLNMNDFCMLICILQLYWIFYYSNRDFGSVSVMMESLWFSLYKSMLYAKSNHFLSFFLCLIALARTSSVLLKRSTNSEHPCTVPHLRGNFLVFDYWVWYQLFIYDPYYIEVVSLYS